MKKIALLVLLAMVAAVPAQAAAKKKAAKPPANPNEAGWRLIRDSLPMFIPTPVKIIYYHQQKQDKKGKK
jgi:hypothetical protein